MCARRCDWKGEGRCSFWEVKLFKNGGGRLGGVLWFFCGVCEVVGLEGGEVRIACPEG